MDPRTVPIARPPRNRIPLTELRRARAVARDVQSRQGADARGNGRLAAAICPGGAVVLTSEQRMLLKAALEREAEERGKYSKDLAADAERVRAKGYQASGELLARAARLACESDAAMHLRDLVYVADSVTISLAPSQRDGGGR